MASTPASSAPISGGSRRPAAGHRLKPSQAATMAPAMAGSWCSARTRSSPKRRNTPATMPMTMGIGTACIARRTQPDAPSASTSSPVAM